MQFTTVSFLLFAAVVLIGYYLLSLPLTPNGKIDRNLLKGLYTGK